MCSMYTYMHMNLDDWASFVKDRMSGINHGRYDCVYIDTHELEPIEEQTLPHWRSQP